MLYCMVGTPKSCQVITYRMSRFHYYKKDNSYLTMYVQLAVGLVYELGIHKNARGDSDGQGGQFCNKYFGFAPSAQLNKVRTLEERRTSLAVFLITSMCVSWSITPSPC